MSSSSENALPLGTVIGGRYRIDGPLGQGGYGVVYHATSLAPDGHHRPVALKLLHAHLCGSEHVLKRFLREAAMTRALVHENIVATLDQGHTESGAPYIVFERLEGVSLDQWAKRRAVTWMDAARIGEHVLAALVAAHDAGIAHRDIKPQNIMLCGADLQQIKVLDFGIAKAFEQTDVDATKLTNTGALMGTARYMAPEQVRAAEVDHRADIYALGITLAELVKGSPLLRGTRRVDVLFEHVAPSEHVLPPYVADTPLGPIIARAIRKDREQRFASARAMLEALLAIERAPAAGARPIQGTVLMPAKEASSLPTPQAHGPAAGFVAATVTSHASLAAPVARVDATIPMADASGGRQVSTGRSASTGRSVSTGQSRFQPITSVPHTPAPRRWLVPVALLVLTSIALAGVLGWRYGVSAAPSKEASSRGSSKRKNGRGKSAASSSSASDLSFSDITEDQLIGRLGRLGWKVSAPPEVTTDDTTGRRVIIQVTQPNHPGGGVVELYRFPTSELATTWAAMLGRIEGQRVAKDGAVLITVMLHDGGVASARLLAKLLLP